MKNWLIILGIVVIACSAPACKKLGMGGGDGDDKGYIVEGGGGIVPPNPSGSDCLKKGSLGVQGLLLKGECPKVPQPVTAPICGNNLLEKDEACDDGNTKDGDGCSATCKKEAGGGNKEGQVVPIVAGAPKIITESIGDGKLGEEYSATVEASGKAVSDDYVWTVDGLPSDKFETLSKTNYLKIFSKDSADTAGKYVAKVKVCLKSDKEKCSAVKDFTFSIVDQYQIVATPFGSDGKPLCTSNASCGAFELKPAADSPYYFTAWNKKETADMNDPYYVLKLSVEKGMSIVEPVSVGSKYSDPKVGYAENSSKLYYQWSITIDGKPAPLLTWVEYLTAGDKLSDATKDSLFLMDVADDMKATLVYPSEFRLMAGPKAMGKTFQNVVITVKSTKGGTQSITFDKVSLPKLEVVKMQFDAIKKIHEDNKAANDPCSDQNKPIITVTEPPDTGKPIDVVLGSNVSLKFTVKSKADLSDKISVMTDQAKKSGFDESYVWKKSKGSWVGGLGTYEYSRILRYGNIPLSSAGVGVEYSLKDINTILVSYGCNAAPVVKTISYNVKYPKLDNVSIGALLKVNMKIGANDTDEDTLWLAIVGPNDSSYFYAGYNDNKGIGLDQYGDNASGSCNNAIDINQECEVNDYSMKSYDTNYSGYVQGSAASGDIRNARLKAYVETKDSDAFGNLDVHIHYIKVIGKYWEFEYGNNQNNFTKEQDAVTKGDNSSGDWYSSGALPWKRRAVPDYDGQ